MKRTIQIAVVLFALLPGIAKAQWTFDIVSVKPSGTIGQMGGGFPRYPSQSQRSL